MKRSSVPRFHDYPPRQTSRQYRPSDLHCRVGKATGHVRPDPVKRAGEWKSATTATILRRMVSNYAHLPL